MVGWHPPLHLFIITKDKSFSTNPISRHNLASTVPKLFCSLAEIKNYNFYASSDLLLECIGLNGCVDLSLFSSSCHHSRSNYNLSQHSLNHIKLWCWKIQNNLMVFFSLFASWSEILSFFLRLLILILYISF